jgi:hypothetical protein
LEQRVSSFGQIVRLDKPSVELVSSTDVGVELGKALDLDQASSHGTAS